MPSTKMGGNLPAPGHAVRGLVVVARDQRGVYRAIRRVVGESQEVAVLLDRRGEDRRRRSLAVPADRRRMERRSRPRLEDDLGRRQYVVVRPPSRRPHD